MDSQIIGVKEFVDILNETLGFAYPSVTVEGEVSAYKINQGKWVFFDLKDDDVTMGCFMPVYSLKVPLEDGMKVRVTGSPKLTKWGKFSFTARTVELAGEGELKRAYQLLKTRLEKEGLFDPSRKRPLPTYPKTIGLITSGTSAAYADFLKILAARWGGLTIQLADVTVQGQTAVNQVTGALDYFNQSVDQPDVLVLIRGGGSLEDLAAFNMEAVARAVAASRTPIVVGVGHEVDTTLADLAADIRAATPTDAARLVVPDRTDIIRQIGAAQSQIQGSWRRLLEIHRERITHSMESISRFINQPRQRVDNLARVLASFDPAAVLRRGYSIVRAGGKVVTNPNQVSSGQALVIQLAEGNLGAKANNDD